MKVLTYNIHGWRDMNGASNLASLVQVIRETEADIVGLNEVFHPRIMDGAAEPALEHLAHELGMNFVFGPCLRWPATDEMPANAYGNALLSRWPIIASAAHHLTPVADKEQRGVLEGRILLTNRETFTCYVTHLDHTDEEARLIQLRALRSWTVRDRNRPHIVMGDFNAVSPWDFADYPEQLERLAAHPKGAHMAGYEKGPRVITQMEKAGYHDTLREWGQPQQSSFIPATDQPIRIDYIFVSQPLVPSVQSCTIWQEAPGKEASDHRPVLVELS